MVNVIRLNDPTSHGGIVASVTATHFTVGGISVARVGDKCTCPVHGDGTIIGGDPHHTIDGIRVAYEGDATSCGATLTWTVTNFGRSEKLRRRSPSDFNLADLGSCPALHQQLECVYVMVP